MNYEKHDEISVNDDFLQENNDNVFDIPEFKPLKSFSVDKYGNVITKIAFSDIPDSFKDEILKKIVFSIILFVFFSVFVFIGLFKWQFIILPFVLSFLLLTSAYYKYKLATSDNIVKFEGVIVSSVKVGFRSFKHMIITLENENGKMISFRLNENKLIRDGFPMVIYLNKNQPIINSMYGPFVEKIVGKTFGANISQTKKSHSKNEHSYSADDYFNEK